MKISTLQRTSTLLASIIIVVGFIALTTSCGHSRQVTTVERDTTVQVDADSTSFQTPIQDTAILSDSTFNLDLAVDTSPLYNRKVDSLNRQFNLALATTLDRGNITDSLKSEMKDSLLQSKQSYMRQMATLRSNNLKLNMQVKKLRDSVTVTTKEKIITKTREPNILYALWHWWYLLFGVYALGVISAFIIETRS
jgi:hypothetical protein